METDIEARVEEYFKRTLQLNPLILADQGILNRVMSAVSHQYDDKKLDESVMVLGEGKSNRVYNIGSVTLPDNNQEIQIALRLMNITPLFFHNDYSRSELEKELKECEAAYALGENTPYFISVVTFFPYGESNPAFMGCGILTEDISKKHTLSLTEKGFSHVERTYQDGSKQLFFVDPFNFKELGMLYGEQRLGLAKRICSASKYLEDKARIDVGFQTSPS